MFLDVQVNDLLGCVQKPANCDDNVVYNVNGSCACMPTMYTDNDCDTSLTIYLLNA